MSRILPCEPFSTISTRKYRENAPEELETIAIYSSKIRALLDQPLPCHPGTNELVPPAICLSDKAKSAFVEYFNENELAQAADGKFATVKGFASKLAENAARLAANIALFEDPEATTINPTCMQEGIALTRFYADEALRLFGVGRDDPDLLLAQEVLDWMKQRGSLHSLVSVYQKGPMGVRDQKTARRIMRILEDHGWVRLLPGTHEIDGFRRREVYEVL